MIIILLKKSWRDTKPEVLTTISPAYGGSLLVGDLFEFEGKEYNVTQRRWDVDGLSVIVEAGNGEGVVKAAR